MENALCGRDEDPAAERWESYDLKPIDYFYPERDLVPDPLVSEGTLSKLADTFQRQAPPLACGLREILEVNPGRYQIPTGRQCGRLLVVPSADTCLVRAHSSRTSESLEDRTFIR